MLNQYPSGQVIRGVTSSKSAMVHGLERVAEAKERAEQDVLAEEAAKAAAEAEGPAAVDSDSGSDAEWDQATRDTL
jgi:hypothetical protein